MSDQDPKDIKCLPQISEEPALEAGAAWFPVPRLTFSLAQTPPTKCLLCAWYGARYGNLEMKILCTGDRQRRASQQKEQPSCRWVPCKASIKPRLPPAKLPSNLEAGSPPPTSEPQVGPNLDSHVRRQERSISGGLAFRATFQMSPWNAFTLPSPSASRPPTEPLLAKCLG